jgi:hypothetical protein
VSKPQAGLDASPATTSLSILINMNLENGMTTQSASAINWLEKLATAEKDGIKQGKGKLGNADRGFCCLGYGCFVGNIPHRTTDGSNKKFQKSVGLMTATGLPDSGSHGSCSSMNDDMEYSFSKISQVLQEYPHHYFIPEVAQSIKEHFA